MANTRVWGPHNAATCVTNSGSAANARETIVSKLEQGDLLLFYSDGIQDQQSPAEEEYGVTQLFKALRTVCDQSPKTVVDTIFADLDKFTDGGSMHDDQTIVAVKVT